MGTDIIEVLSDSFAVYREKWEDVVGAFLALFLVGLGFQVAGIAIGLVRGVACSLPHPLVIIGLCLPLLAVQIGLGILQWLLNGLMTFSALKPLSEMIDGRKISSWTGHLKPQAVNAIKVLLFRFIVHVLLAVPLIVFTILNFALIFAAAMRASSGGGVLLVADILLFLAAVLLTIIAELLANFLLSFLEVEVVLNGRGVLSAAGSSVSLVRANFADVFLFDLAWFMLGIGIWWGMGLCIGLIVCSMCCLLPLAIVVVLVTPLVVVPLWLTSNMMLWKRLGGEVAKKKK